MITKKVVQDFRYVENIHYDKEILNPPPPQFELRYFFTINISNQSIENAGVAFVKRADERNEFFEKINKQSFMTKKVKD